MNRFLKEMTDQLDDAIGGFQALADIINRDLTNQWDSREQRRQALIAIDKKLCEKLKEFGIDEDLPQQQVAFKKRPR